MPLFPSHSAAYLSRCLHRHWPHPLPCPSCPLQALPESSLVLAAAAETARPLANRPYTLALTLTLTLTARPPANWPSAPARRYGSRSFLNGWADAGEVVTITAGGAKGMVYTTTADAAGDWRVMLNPGTGGSGGGITISVKGESGPAVVANRVVSGDVLFCSGQSNMVFPTSLTLNASEVIHSADYPAYRNIRLFTVPQAASSEPQRDINGTARWLPSNSTNVKDFSAVCFQTAQRLIDLHVGSRRAIGLVFSAVGGTRVEAWMAPKALRTCTSHGHVIPPGRGNNVPSVLFNAMVAPLQYMSVRAVLWYQVCVSAPAANATQTVSSGSLTVRPPTGPLAFPPG